MGTLLEYIHLKKRVKVQHNLLAAVNDFLEATADEPVRYELLRRELIGISPVLKVRQEEALTLLRAAKEELDESS